MVARVAVEGRSMEPVYFQGDFILVARLGKIKRGNDVVVCDPREKGRLILKRVAKKKGRELFLEGLNKNFSTDSRNFGWIDEDEVQAKVVLRYYPFFGRGKFWFW